MDRQHDPVRTPATRRIEGPVERVMRFLTDARKNLLPHRHMSTAERRAIQRSVANDPDVDRALRELLAERPELRRKDAPGGGIQGRFR